MVVIDASVWVAADSDETGRAVSEAFLSALLASGATIHQPTLTLVELTAAVARRTRDEALGREAGGVVMAVPGLVLHDLDVTAAADASIVAAGALMRGADAVYGACALATGSILVTLDQDQLERSPSGLRVMTPEGWLRRSGQATG